MPSFVSMKSCVRTAIGLPFAASSRPTALKSPTSAFFLVSTEITGWPAANAVAACSLM